MSDRKIDISNALVWLIIFLVFIPVIGVLLPIIIVIFTDGYILEGILLTICAIGILIIFTRQIQRIYGVKNQ